MQLTEYMTLDRRFMEVEDWSRLVERSLGIVIITFLLSYSSILVLFVVSFALVIIFVAIALFFIICIPD